MYSEEIKTTLTNRIGFGTPQEEGFAISVDEANSIGESGRMFASFHALATLENIYAGIPDLDGEDAAVKFNAILENYRKEATLAVLPLILDSNKGYVYADDYDTSIEQSISLFDQAIGFKGAIMILEMLLSTKESNIAERNAKLTAANLKLELNGFKNDAGVVVASGLYAMLEQAINNAKAKLFPVNATVQKGKDW